MQITKREFLKKLGLAGAAGVTGTAAALSAKAGATPRALDVALLRKTLAAKGAYLG